MSRSTAFVLAGALVSMALAAPAHAEGELTPRDIYRTMGKAVVLVFATDGSAQGSAGTGSIITSDGQVITNSHVVAKDGRPYKKLFVYLKPEKITGSMQDDLKHRYEAQVVDIDYDLDLALLKMKAPPAGLPTIAFADPESVEIGDPVVAIGHPETGGLWTMTTGIVSSVVKDFNGITGKDVFQTEASINRGNSGGPLLNVYGQMVGINTSISRRAADGLAITAINFSLKSSVPMNWIHKKDLLAINYAKTGPGLPSGALAQATPPEKATTPPAVAEAPKAQASTDQADGETYTVKSEEGKAVVVVEPEKGEEVADVDWNEATATTVVAGAMKAPPKGKAPPAKPASEAKMLTPRRPYKMEPFVEARIKEIKALEKDMDMARDRIDEKRGRKTKRPKADGMGLW